MSKRNQNIEDWLRQAAAQGPEVSSDQVKQQAWGQLSNMLDEEETSPRSFGSGWWMIIIEAMILVGCFTYVAVTEKEVSFAEERYLPDTAAVAIVKEPLTSVSSVEEKYSPDTAIAAFIKEPPASPDEAFLSIEELHTSLSGVTHSVTPFAKEKHLSPAYYPFLSKKAQLPIKSKASSSSVNRRQPAKRSSTGAVYWNTDPPEKTPSGQQERRLRYAGNSSSRQNPEAIHPLSTRQLFIPVKDSGVQHTPVPKTPRSHRERKDHSPYSLKIAAILPIADAYGAAASIEYTFQWREKWRIRPYIGGEYLTGFNKVYDHRYYAAFSSGGAPWGQGMPAWTDSVLTHFTLNGIIYGKAGVQAAYVFSKWELAAGIEYRHVFNVSGKDTTFKVHRDLVSGPVDLQRVPFNKKQVTGAGNVRLQLGLDYTINRRLQIGATYYMQFRKRLDSAYRRPYPKLPDQSSFQVHLRYNFMRKPHR